MHDIKNEFISILDFLRVNLCMYSIFFGTIGYLLFNELSLNILWISFSCFFLVAGVYSYNNITDKSEDAIYRKKINKYSTLKSGYGISALCFVLGIFFSSHISTFSLDIALLFSVAGVVYSYFRIKSHLLIKNLYTAFSLASFFLLGAGSQGYESALYYLLFSTIIFLGSVISDLRDFEGDRKSGVKTLPVVFGYDNARRLICAGLFFSVLFTYFLDIVASFVLVPFLCLMFFYVTRNMPKKAHQYGNLSVVFLAVWLFIILLY